MSLSPPIIKAPRFTVVLTDLDEIDRIALQEAVNQYTQTLTQHVAELAALTVEALIADGRPVVLEKIPNLLRAIKAEKRL
jgi:hypothetical protein